MATKNTERVALLTKYNKAYRAGKSLIKDQEYDLLKEELRKWDPTNQFLLIVEEEDIKGKKVKHSSPMLSIDKVYELDDLAKFVVKMENAAKENGFSANVFRVTPKLDGMAGKDRKDFSSQEEMEQQEPISLMPSLSEYSPSAVEIKVLAKWLQFFHISRKIAL